MATTKPYRPKGSRRKRCRHCKRLIGGFNGTFNAHGTCDGTHKAVLICICPGSYQPFVTRRKRTVKET